MLFCDIKLLRISFPDDLLEAFLYCNKNYFILTLNLADLESKSVNGLKCSSKEPSFFVPKPVITSASLPGAIESSVVSFTG
ncbi:hypothetical protein SDC49_19625 [Lactobacillus sp. R2/2]|nr:hypothetical protein [Lactobacillus sp. R2/2]